MSNEDTRQDGMTDTWASGSRRSLLKAVGVGAGLAVLGGGSATAQETTTTQQRDETSEIHPVFGLALAADDAMPDGINPAQVVELYSEEGQGTHAEFPLQPDPEEPGQFGEVPAEFFFDPVGVRLAPGDVVNFKNVSNLHTVTAFHEKFGDEKHLPIQTRLPDGVPGFTSPPYVGGESWLYEFTEPGVYDLLCLPHLGFGMVQRIVVADQQTDVEAPGALSGEAFANAQTVLTAPELEPQHIMEAETVGWSDLTLELKTPTETTTTSS